MDDRVAAVRDALAAHPGVRRVRLVGSRAEGRGHALSDWDLYVEAADFDRVAAELPELLEPHRPLAQFWDPYSDHDAYMVILRGPTKLDLCFFDREREWSGPWEVRADTLEAIDRHFWDWIIWTEQKRRGGKAEQVAESLRHMQANLLGPMGEAGAPTTVKAALSSYVAARDRQERELGVTVPRDLEAEIRPVVEAG